jgi:hypothetical protein
MLSSPYDKRSKRGLNLSNSGPAKDVEREEAERHEVLWGGWLAIVEACMGDH